MLALGDQGGCLAYAVAIVASLCVDELFFSMDTDAKQQAGDEDDEDAEAEEAKRRKQAEGCTPHPHTHTTIHMPFMLISSTSPSSFLNACKYIDTSDSSNANADQEQTKSKDEVENEARKKRLAQLRMVKQKWANRNRYAYSCMCMHTRLIAYHASDCLCIYLSACVAVTC
jgi:hypothetical protein